MTPIDIESVLKKLTISEKVDLLSGADFWHTKALPKHGIPSVRLSDGPNGVRGTKFFNGARGACFPCGTALGATFDLPLLEEAGRKMGDEARAKGAHCILGPTINMQRSPLNGRAFESIAEDPILSGQCAGALVKGIQATGVQATIKHWVANDQEHRRNAVYSILTQRALREIYALPFQVAMRDSAPAAIMTGYNGVNGKWCSDSKELLEGILRQEWKWDGLVMSDWWGTYSTTEATLAGLDLEMPGPTRFRGEALKFNVTTDKVREHILDERVRSVLKFVNKCAAAGVPENAPETEVDTPETAALLRRIAAESIVLLKNEGGVLPLKKDKKTVVIGPNAKVAFIHGGGSASLAPYYAVTPYDGITSKLGAKPAHTVGAYAHKMLPLITNVTTHPSGDKAGLRMRVYNEAPGDDAAAPATRECQDEIHVTRSEMILFEYVNPKLTSPLWHADLEGSLTPDADGTWEFSLVVAGAARLFVDGKLVIDNATKQTQGDAFFGTATVEEFGRLDLKAGQTYAVRVEFASIPASKLNMEGHGVKGGALRVGACPVIDADEEIQKAVEMARGADQVVLCVGLNADWETEGADRSDIVLPGRTDALVSAVAAANPRTVVALQSGSAVAMPWVDSAAAVVQAWYGGNETGNALADVLFGDVNPSARLPLTFPRRVQDNPAFLNFRAEAGRTWYGEDVYVGYRYYEFADRDVLFPFGHGLSYTQFKFSDCVVESKDDRVLVRVRVENVGAVAGAEVVQVYVAPGQPAKINRPRKELKGFTKVLLGPGEAKEVVVEMETKYAASYWDEERDKWCAEQGRYRVIVSDSSVVTDGKTCEGEFVVGETFWWTGL